MLRAVQAAADGSPAATQLVRMQGLANAHVASQGHSVVQLVKSPDKRKQTDIEIDALKERLIQIFGQLTAKGNDWKNKWGEQAEEASREKANSILRGEKGDSTEVMIAKKLWAQLSTEEKIDIVTQVGSTGFRLAQEALSQVEFGGGGNSGGRSETRREKQPAPRKQERGKDEGSSSAYGSAVLSALEQVTSDDLEAAYKVMKKKNELQKRLDEARDQIVGKVGNVGRGVGEFTGELYDEHQFAEMIGALTPELNGAIGKFSALRDEIEQNEDSARYAQTLEAIQVVLHQHKLPMLAFVAQGQIAPEQRLRFPDDCRVVVSLLGMLSHGGMVERGGAAFFGAVRGLKTGLGFEASDQGRTSEVAVAQERAASALKRLVRQDWSKATGWFFQTVPSGVGKLRKLDAGMDAAKYLGAAKEEAEGFGAGGDNRNKQITQPVYTALAGIEPENKEKLERSRSVFAKAENDLLAKT